MPDPRSKRGRRWRHTQLLTAALVGLAAGCRGLADVEILTSELPMSTRRKLDLTRRVPDTTLRHLLTALDPTALRRLIHRQIKAAHRRKQLDRGDLPFGIVAIDGKVTAVPQIDDQYAQRQHLTDGNKKVIGIQGLVRTLTCCLVTSRAKVCIDAVPIPAKTNEVGHFGVAFGDLMAAYGRSNLFSMVTMDAGFTSAQNAATVHDAGLAYLMHLKDDRRELTAAAMRRLGHLGTDEAIATTVDKVGSAVVTRRLWTAPLSDVEGWPHLRKIIRVQSERVTDTEVIVHDRYYATNYGASALTAAQWLTVVRSHWAVENNCHWTFDVAFLEDERPWLHHPQGMVNTLLLRRVVYNMLALFRAVTLRSAKSRATPWRHLVTAVRDALIRATDAVWKTIRPRNPRAAPT